MSAPDSRDPRPEEPDPEGSNAPAGDAPADDSPLDETPTEDAPTDEARSDEAPETRRAGVPADETPGERTGRGGLRYCLFGAAVVFAAVLVSVGILFMEVRKLSKPKYAWPYIDGALDFDERPADWTLEAGIGKSFFTGYSFFVFADEADGLRAHLMLEVDASAMGTLFAAHANDAVRTVLGEGTVTVQGRELRYLDVESSSEDGLYRSRLVDFGPEDAGHGAVLELLRPKDAEPITDEDVRRELAPFRVGPER